MAKKQTRRSISISRAAYDAFKIWVATANGVSMSGVVEGFVRDLCGLPPLTREPRAADIEEPDVEPVIARRITVYPPKPKVEEPLPSFCGSCIERPPVKFHTVDGKRIALCGKCGGIEVKRGAPCQHSHEGGTNVPDPKRCDKPSRFKVDLDGRLRVAGRAEDWSPVCGVHARFWRLRGRTVEELLA